MRIANVPALLVAFPLALSAGVPRTAGAAPPRSPARPASVTALLPFNVNTSQSSRTMRPGDARAEVFRVALHNTNLLLGSDQVTELTLTNRVSGSATTAQKDAEWQSFTVVAGRRASDVTNPAARTPIATASASGGTVRLTGLGQNMNPGDSLYLVVLGAPSLLARDPDALDLYLANTSAVHLANGTTVNVATSGTLDPAGAVTVDGMTAAQVQLKPIDTPYFPVGSTDQLALALRVPPNGWEADRLTQLVVVQRGTAQAGSDLAGMTAWLDDGDGTWESGQEAELGRLAFTGGSWVLGGRNAEVPAPAGAWLYVTVDVAETARENSTVRLALPVSGLEMLGTNDGPLDREVSNPFEHVVSLLDHVVVSPLRLSPGVAHPGDARVPLLAVQASNLYTAVRTLSGLTVTNRSVGPGTTADLDGEISRVELRLDGDADQQLDDVATDPPIASALLVNGRAAFSTFSLPLPAGQTRTLFVTGDVSLQRSRDGDTLALEVGAREDLVFSDTPVALAGTFPLESGAPFAMDGRMAAEIGNAGAPPVAMAPGDGPIEALDLLVHRNGYADDVLESVSIVNLGTATGTDLATMQLWRDGGDGAFDGGAADDRLLGALVPGPGGWTSPALAEPVGAVDARLFVSVTVAAAPADSATVRLALPVGGLAVASGDDGPIDAAVENPDAQVVTNTGLLATLGFGTGSATVGQSVSLTLHVRSTAAESLLAVTPAAPAFTGSAALTLLAPPSPPARDLAPGESGDFTWTFRADGSGTVRALASAAGTASPSGTPVASVDASSGTLRVFARADSLPFTAADAMPQAVTRGQRGVLPLYLTFVHPDADGSDVRLTALAVRLERGDGSGVAPASLLASAAVVAASETLLVRTSLESSGATMDLTLARPAIVASGQPVTLALALEISSATVVPDFRVLLASAADVRAEDAATGAPVEVRLQAAEWPVRTGLARVQAGATRLDVSATALSTPRAGQGQTGVTLAAFSLQSPGVSGVTTDVRAGAFDVRLTDTLGTPLPKPGRIVRRLRVVSGTQLLAERLVAPGADTTLALTLSPLLAVPVNTPIEMRLVADLSDTASLGAFRLQLGAVSRFDARDPNTGAPVPVAYAASPLAGPPVLIERRADSVAVLGVPHLPPTLGLGARGVAALSLVLRHPGAPGTARLRVDTLVVRCLDGSGAPLVPGTFIDRMQITWNGALAASVADPPASGSTMLAVIPGAWLEPGDTARVTCVLDFETAAPASTFALAVGAAGLHVTDANLGTSAAAVVENGGEFPLLSGLTRLVPPSRLLATDLADAMPPVLAPDGRDVVAGTLRLENGALDGSGPVRVRSLRIRAMDAAGAVVLGAAAGRVSVAVDGAPFASSATLSPDSLTGTIEFPSDLTLPPGEPVDLELRFSTRTDPAAGSFALCVSAGDIGVVQPGNPLLDVSVLPAPGRAFPLATSRATYAAASLVDSWSSFPNPFSPARGPATFAFYLPGAARATLEIRTSRGERVASVLDGRELAAGLHQDVTWDGRNGRGMLVMGGVYVAELNVRFGDGRSQTLRRKVAVIR